MASLAGKRVDDVETDLELTGDTAEQAAATGHVELVRADEDDETEVVASDSEAATAEPETTDAIDGADAEADLGVVEAHSAENADINGLDEDDNLSDEGLPVDVASDDDMPVDDFDDEAVAEDEVEAALTEGDELDTAASDDEEAVDEAVTAADGEDAAEAVEALSDLPGDEMPDVVDEDDGEAVSEVAEVAAEEVVPEPEPQRAPLTRREELRVLEALLFASPEPLDIATLAKRMPDDTDVKGALAQLQEEYAERGVNLIKVANKWTFRTAYDLAWLMTRESSETRKLSRAAVEVLAIVAYHQPVTRGEIEEIRGVVTSKGTLDVLLETGWIRPRGRRKTPGRPLTFGTTESFLSQFSLESLGDLPGLEELKGTGLLDSRLPTGFSVPNPSDDPTLREDEDPLEVEDLQLALAPAIEPEEEPQAQPERQQGEGTDPAE